jgi:hypothetical protein
LVGCVVTEAAFQKKKGGWVVAQCCGWGEAAARCEEQLSSVGGNTHTQTDRERERERETTQVRW